MTPISNLRKLLVAALLIGMLAGCTSASTTENTPTISVQQPDQPPGREEYAAIDLETHPFLREVYPAAVQSNEAWVNDPVLLSLRFAGYSSTDDPAPEKVLTYHGPENTVVVVILDENLMDDSVRDRETRVDLIYKAGLWKIEWAGYRQQCRRGPSTGWTADLCP